MPDERPEDAEHHSDSVPDTTELSPELSPELSTEPSTETSQELGRRMLDSMYSAVSLIDIRTHRIVDVNRTFLARIGRERKDVVGRLCHEVAQECYEPCHGPGGTCPLHVTLVTGEPNRVEHVTRAPDGSEVFTEICVSPVYNDAGEVVQVVHLVQDVTQHRLSEEALRQTSAAAEAASEAKSIFLANVSHELRTPLNPIVAMSKLLELTSLDAEQQRYVDLIERGAQQLLSTVNDLLDFSKAEAGRLELERVDFDLVETLESCLGLCAAECLRRGLELQWRVAENVPSRLRGDPFRMNQILHNLISNAIKFTPHGEIHVRVDLEDSDPDGVTLRFVVEDTGIGIPKERQRELFESFTQADASVSRLHGGTGLGLAISKQIVELMGGRIGVESIEGEGASFWFTARLEVQPHREPAEEPHREPAEEPHREPAEEPHREPAEEPAEEVTQEAAAVVDSKRRLDCVVGRSSREPSVATAPRILVAEDNPSNQRVVQQILVQGGYRVDMVDSGVRALEHLRSGRFDLVIMDVQMPDMDGIEVTQRIRDPTEAGLPTRIPIVAATAFVQPADRERCIQAGMNGFITKPIDPRELLEVVDRELNRSTP